MMPHAILVFSILLTAALVAIALFFPSYKYALLALILIRPFVDSTWNYRYMGISLIDLAYFGFVLIFFIRLLLRKEKVLEFPHLKVFVIYFHIILIVSFHIFFKSGFIFGLEFFIKTLFMPLSFYLFYVYFKDYKSGKALITVFIIAGIVPIFFSILQKFTGQIGTYRHTRGLVRSVGLYHDAVTSRIFLLSGLVAIMIFWHYFIKKEQKAIKFVIAVLFFSSLIALYFLYSKAVIITLSLWCLAFTFLKKKVYLIPLILIGLFIMNHYTHNRIYNELDQVFSRETEYIRGDLDSDYVLSGRGRLWRFYFSDWKKLPLINKVIGDGTFHGGFHNDFLRLLFNGGILLLSYYVLLVLILSSSVVYYFFKKGEFIQFIAILCVLYFLVESMGQLPGLYPDIQVLTWGIVGLSLNRELEWARDKDEESSEEMDDL